MEARTLVWLRNFLIRNFSVYLVDNAHERKLSIPLAIGHTLDVARPNGEELYRIMASLSGGYSNPIRTVGRIVTLEQGIQ
jgi:hypothetical protein